MCYSAITGKMYMHTYAVSRCPACGPLHDLSVPAHVGQEPEHSAVDSPSVAPYFPAGQFVHVVAVAKLYFPTGHNPLQSADGAPAVAPNCPAPQLLQLLAPARLNVPTGHMLEVVDKALAAHE